jgi:hypothetical protein
MPRKPVPVHASPQNEVRVPADWLPELGIAEGEPASPQLARGRLVLTRLPDLPGVQSRLSSIAERLEVLRDELAETARELPEPLEPLSGAEAAADAESDVLGTIECLLSDEFDPAIRKLRAVAAATHET